MSDLEISSADSTAREARRGIILIFVAGLLWSTGGVGIKLVVASPLVIAFWRSAIASVVLFAALRPQGWTWSPAFLGAVLSYAGCLTTFVIATRWTTAANAIFLQYAGIIWVMLFSPLVTGESLKRRDVIAVAVAMTGMVLFFADDLGGGALRGNLVALLSSFFFASLVLLLRRERGASAEAAVIWGNVLAAAMILPLVRNHLRVDARSAAILVFLGVFQIGLAYVLFVKGIRFVSAVAASLTGMIEPVANPLWVFLGTGEIPGSWALLGGLIVLGAIGWRTPGESDRGSLIPPPD